MHLNTELGFVIDSAALASQMAAQFDHDIARQAYRVGLAPDGSLYWLADDDGVQERYDTERSEEHTSELQSLMRISYAVFCLKKKKKRKITTSSGNTTRVQRHSTH